MNDTADDILLTVPEFADVLDERASTLRDWLANDPGRIPRPLVFKGTGLVRWPLVQINAWIAAGAPRDFEHDAAEFVPWLVAFHDEAKALAGGGVEDRRRLIEQVYGNQIEGGE